MGGNISEEARPAGALWAAVPHRASRAYMVPRRSILVQVKAVTSPRFTPSRNAGRKREVSLVLLIIETQITGVGDDIIFGPLMPTVASGSAEFLVYRAVFRRYL